MRSILPAATFGLVALLPLQILVAQAAEPSKVLKRVSVEGKSLDVVQIAEVKDVVWGFDFLSPDRLIFTQRNGKIFIQDLRQNSLSEVQGAPAVFHQGQGGLLDVRAHPSFKTNSLVYLTYSQPQPNDEAATALAVAKLESNALKDLKVLFTANNVNSNSIHFGSRIEFRKESDGKTYLYMTLGERNERHSAQKLDSHAGKIIRLNLDGSVPNGNPFGASAVWSMGHRNPQGLALHPETQELWSAEFGPRGGDEINLIQKGANYGWPVVTYGREYWGPSIGEGFTKPGMVDSIVHYVPSISPSGIAFYSGKLISDWKNDLFIACLSGTHLRKVTLKNNQAVQQTEILSGEGWRFREVREGPDGFIYFSTDLGLIARLQPVK
jgi:glucose/arabinose dehydrogenase